MQLAAVSGQLNGKKIVKYRRILLQLSFVNMLGMKRENRIKKYATFEIYKR
jgi:hypothetical protein